MPKIRIFAAESGKNNHRPASIARYGRQRRVLGLSRSDQRVGLVRDWNDKLIMVKNASFSRIMRFLHYSIYHGKFTGTIYKQHGKTQNDPRWPADSYMNRLGTLKDRGRQNSAILWS